MSNVGPRANSTAALAPATIFAMAEAPPWIAIVDDDPSVLKALSRLLRTRALDVRTNESAQEFLAALPYGPPECLIVDLRMPEMSGLELLQHLRSRDIQVPTIVITAHGDIGVRERCESAGAVAFLLKPLQDTALFAAIDLAGGSPFGPDQERCDFTRN
jgi:FixJ family two-component response regulator